MRRQGGARKQQLAELSKLDKASPIRDRGRKAASPRFDRRSLARSRVRAGTLERFADMTTSPTIAVVGLGYVGLPLAVEFGKQYPTIGFDLSQAKIDAYRRGVDPTGEVSRADLAAADAARGHDRSGAAASARTSSSSPCRRRSTTRTSPISARCSARAKSVGRNLKRGAIVVFESTVYPGATEEICVPVIERHSGMTVEARFLRRLFARAHQPGRQASIR